MLDSLKKALESAHEELDSAVAKAAEVADEVEAEARSQAVQAIHDVITTAESDIKDALAKLHLPKGTKKAS